MASQYKVIYFDARGKAERIRLTFAAAGQNFVDERLDKDKVAELKPSLPFGQLPVLEMDGQYFAQSVAIANFVARQFGLYGKSNVEALQIDQVVQQTEDIIQNVIIPVYYEKDEAAKEKLIQETKETKVPKNFKPLETLLEKNKTGYFVGSELSLADISIFDIVDMISQMNILDLKDYPGIQAHKDKVSSHPKLAEYLKNRK